MEFGSLRDLVLSLKTIVKIESFVSEL